MAKPKSVKPAVQAALNTQPVLPSSIRDAGQMVARAGDSLERVANWCAANIPDFPKAVSKENRALFKDGVWIHYQTVKPAVYYRREGKNLVKLDTAPEKLDADTIKLDVSFCTGMTGQAFGGLKSTDPALYDAVNLYRDDCNKYAANRWNAVVRFYNAMHSAGHKRGSSKSFKDRMTETFATLAKSIKVARENRGDATAPTDEQFKAAVKAFWTALAK